MQFFLSITLITGAFCAPGGVAQSPVPKPGMGGKIKLPSGMTKAKLSSGMGAKPVKPVTMPKLTPGKVNIGGKGGKPFTMPTSKIPKTKLSSGMGAKPVKPVTMPKLTPGKVNIGGKGGKPFTMPTNTIPHARIPGAKGM